ncbi:putative Peptidoglycan-binding lysin domain [uncultured Paludibacter sp.]|nr:putative Peptidoglycan-binding lysin domain [uncultured Paludibacter sp.]
MKKHLKILSLFTFLLLSLTLYSQDTESYPVKVINGAEFYVYTVKSGEGLYSISRRFDVSQSDINNANPQIHDGLKAGEEILIPKKNSLKQALVSEDEKTEYITHKVEKKQTLFAISRIYNVSQDEIIEANPQVKNGLRVGDVIRIPQKSKQKKSDKKSKEIVEQPKTEKTNAPYTTSNLHISKEGAYTTHIVQPKETLYSLSKQYNVTVDDIVKLNPGSDIVLKTGVELKIPVSKNNLGINTTNSGTRTIKKSEKKNTYKIAYLLPFMLNEKTQDATVNKFLDFYMGALLAVKEAQNSGINYEIYTYDTEKSETKLYSVINQPEMQKMDLIIGPAYTAQIPILADFAKRREIYTVVPFSSNVDDIEDNPYIFQFNPDKDLQNFFVVNALKNKFQDANIILVDVENNGQNNDENDSFNFIGNKLDRTSIDFTKITKSDLFTNKIEKYLNADKKNIIIFDAYKLSSVQSYLNDLFDLSKKYDVGVIGQYSWKGETGKKPKMYYVAPFTDDTQRMANAINYENEFTRYYGKLRGEKNPRYDMIGYDITKYFLSLMDKNGFDIEQNTKNMKSNGIQSDMYFKRIGNDGGFMNQQLFLIEDAAKRN